MNTIQSNTVENPLLAVALALGGNRKTFTPAPPPWPAPVIQDDRTPEETAATIGFWFARDTCLSGWGEAPKGSFVGCPVVSEADKREVEKRFRGRSDFREICFRHSDFVPALAPGQHYHIYNTTRSFRY